MRQKETHHKQDKKKYQVYLMPSVDAFWPFKHLANAAHQ